MDGEGRSDETRPGFEGFGERGMRQKVVLDLFGMRLSISGDLPEGADFGAGDLLSFPGFEGLRISGLTRVDEIAWDGEIERRWTLRVEPV